MQLRPYQLAAVQAIVGRYNTPTRDIVNLPTGSGKSLVIAEAVRQINVPTLILQPSAEILEQNKEKLELYFSAEDIGVYSASMNEKVVKKITLATIGSVVNCPHFFTDFPLVLIDEAHSVNPDDKSSMYFTFLKKVNPKKIIGLTATSFRLSNGYISTKNYLGEKTLEQITTIKVITRIEYERGKKFWNGGIIFNIPTQEMIRLGYLHKPMYFDNTKLQHESIPVNKSQSDFRLDKYEELILPHEENILDAIARLSAVSHSVLVFCSSVEQATRYSLVIQNSAVVSAMTKKKDRKNILEKFKTGEIKVVLNVSCLTTGFDHPRLDGLVMIRPTRSLALYSQMVGRILRIHPDKKEARIVDFSGNIKSMGYAESIELYKNGNLPDIRTSKKVGWHGSVLYKMEIQK
jgi:DNA repair protein RadD